MLVEAFGSEEPLANEHFSFSGLKGQTKVGREGLHYFSKRVTLVFSGLDRAFLETIVEKLFEKESVILGNLLLEPEMVEEELMAEPLGDACRYLCISPLVLLNEDVNDKNKEFIHPTSDDFSDFLYESTMERMEQTGKYTAEQIAGFYKFQIVPDVGYLEKITKAEKKFARIYTIVYNRSIKEVRGYTFPFSLYAAPEVQDFIYHCGLGELTGYGFGMLDVYSVNAPKRVVIRGQEVNQGE